MAWEESKHPRDNNGQFTSKGNEGQGGKEDKTEYKGAKIEKLTKLNGEEVYQFGTEDGDVLTFKSLDEAKEYVDKNRDDFDNDNDFELWDNDISDEDVMQELADGDYYYGGLGEQEIYNLVAERLNITPEKAEQALKNQGFDYQEYQNYIEGIDDFDKEFSEAIKNNHEQIKNDVVKKYNDYKQQGLSDKEIKNKISKEYEEKSGIAWLDGETIDKYRKYSDNNKQSSSQTNNAILNDPFFFDDKTRISKYMNEDGTASFTLDDDPRSISLLRQALGKDGVYLLKAEDGLYTVAPGAETTNEQFKNWLLNNTADSYKNKEEKLSDDASNTNKKKLDNNKSINQVTPKQWLDNMKSQSMEGMPENLKKSLNAWIQNEYEKMVKEESRNKK